MQFLLRVVTLHDAAVQDAGHVTFCSLRLTEDLAGSLLKYEQPLSSDSFLMAFYVHPLLAYKQL